MGKKQKVGFSGSKPATGPRRAIRYYISPPNHDPKFQLYYEDHTVIIDEYSPMHEGVIRAVLGSDFERVRASVLDGYEKVPDWFSVTNLKALDKPYRT